LSLLDSAIEASELLVGIAPIRFVTIGGMLAVSLFQNRKTTKDIDFLLDPNVDAVEEYRQEVFRVIRIVAERRGLNEDWMNDELRIFVRRPNRLTLFLQSVEQNLVVYRGRRIIVYAGRLDFALERKLRRINERDQNRPRDLDLSDAVALLHSLKGDGHPLSWNFVQKLDENAIGMQVGEAGIKAVSQKYIELHGSQGVVEMSWDEESQRYRYLGLSKEWVYV
jgi:hypothetical protein